MSRWQKISRLETCNDYRPEPPLLVTPVTSPVTTPEVRTTERDSEDGDKFDTCVRYKITSIRICQIFLTY